MSDKVENIQEAKDTNSAKASDKVMKDESKSDREGLSSEQKQKASDIKTGKQKSGVTDLLGKPSLMDGDGTNVLHSKGFGGKDLSGKNGGNDSGNESSESKAKKGPEGDKHLGEFQKPLSDKAATPQGQIERDSQNRPTEIKYPDGSQTQVKYDQQGNVSEIKSRTGDTMVRQPDGHYDVARADGSTEQFKGIVAVTKDGDVATVGESGATQIRHPNGDETRINADQSQVNSDSNGKVKQVTYGSGETEKITYGKDGQPSEVKASDNSSWKKEPDGSGWNHYKDGKKDGDHLEDVQVRKDGTIDGRGRDGEHFIQRTDGTEEVSPKTIQRDSQDRPTDVTYPDGTKTSVKYDDKGNAEELHTRKGDVMKRVADGQYEVTRADGSKENYKGDVVVDKNGEIVARDASGNTQVRHVNGDETNIKTDRSQVTTDINGNVKDIVTTDQKHIHVSYDHGEMTQVQYGDTMLKKDGTEWCRYEHGKRVEVLNDVNVTPDGVTRTNKAGRTTSWAKDGSIQDRMSE